MLIFPAIDLRGGQVVRLAEGDYERMTVYGDDPAAVAAEFRSQGAAQLHMVDLDAARSGEQVNLRCIERVVRENALFVQVGGGGRDEDSVKRYLDIGVSRVIIGSAAITTPGFLEKMAARHPGKIAAGVDAKAGFIAIHGWREVTDVAAFDFLTKLPQMGVGTAIYTDISRDGLLGGANIEAYQATKVIEGLDVIASGGVSSESDVARLTELDLYGAIIGKALYAGVLDLRRAIQIGGETE